MKKEVSPAVVAAVIAVVVIIIGVFIFRQVNNNAPTPRPNPKFFGGGASTPQSAPNTAAQK